MGTRSRIGVVNPDDSITSIYCHWDGYPEHHLPILTGHYTTEDKAADLIALGSLSSLEPEIGVRHNFDCLQAPGGISRLPVPEDVRIPLPGPRGHDPIPYWMPGKASWSGASTAAPSGSTYSTTANGSTASHDHHQHHRRGHPLHRVPDRLPARPGGHPVWPHRAVLPTRVPRGLL